MSFSPFSLLFFILKRHAIRKAGAVVLLLCMTLLMAEFKGYGQSIWEKLKLPKLPEPPPIHEQTGGGAQPTPPKSENASEQTPSVAEQPAAPSTAQQAADTAETTSTPSENTLATSLEALNFHEGEFDWRKDWWKAMLFALGGVVVVAFLMRIAKQLFRIIVMTACLAAGSFGARYFAPPLTPWFESKLPPSMTQTIPPLYWSFAIVFLVCYIVATIILFILKRPLDIMDKRQKCQSGKVE